MRTDHPTRPLADLVTAANAAHERTILAAGEALRHAAEAGRHLIAAKAQLTHGQWGPWLEEHCDFAPRTARLYMRITARWAELEAQNGTALPIRMAQRLLAPDANLPTSGETPRTAEAEDFRTADAAVLARLKPIRIGRRDYWPAAAPDPDEWRALRRRLFDAATTSHELQAATVGLSITIQANLGAILNAAFPENAAPTWAARCIRHPRDLPMPAFLETFEPWIAETAAALPAHAVPSEAEARAAFATSALFGETWAALSEPDRAFVVGEYRTSRTTAEVTLRETVRSLAAHLDFHRWHDLLKAA